MSSPDSGTTFAPARDKPARYGRALGGCAVDRRSEGNRADRRSSARAKRSDRKGSRGKPSAAVFRQACLVGKVPRSVLGDLVARVAPVSLEVRYLGEAEKRGLTTTLKERPAPPSARAIKARWRHIQCNALGGAGLGLPIVIVGRSDARTNAAPERRRAAPFGATTLKGRIRGHFSRNAPKGAARREWLISFFLSLGWARKRDSHRATHPSTDSPTNAYAPSNQISNQLQLLGAPRGGRATRQFNQQVNPF